MRIDAASMRDAPSRSSRRKAESVKRSRRRENRFCLLVENSDGRQKMIKAVAAAPAGALGCISFKENLEERSTKYLRRNTHRHVVCSLIAPPRRGPTTLDMAKTEEIMAMYFPNFSGGMDAAVMTLTME